MDRERIAAAGVVALFLAFAAIAASQRYTVSDPWKLYVTTVREYMAAGMRGDSTALAQHSATAQPPAWVLDATRRQRAMVAGWAQGLRNGTGQRRGDTVALLLWADNVKGCSHLSSVSALLLNHSSSPRLLAISSPCVDRRALPGLPW